MKLYHVSFHRTVRVKKKKTLFAVRNETGVSGTNLTLHLVRDQTNQPKAISPVRKRVSMVDYYITLTSCHSQQPTVATLLHQASKTNLHHFHCDQPIPNTNQAHLVIFLQSSILTKW